jgi:hypothetical protein
MTLAVIKNDTTGIKNDTTGIKNDTCSKQK